MAQQLWFLRHGEAVPHDAAPDPDRQLTERGEEQSRPAGRALAAMEMAFQIVLSSPRVRALDTARLACEELGIEPEIFVGASAGAIVSATSLELGAMIGAPKRVLFVGHNPDFEQVVHDLTGARVDLKKGGIAAVREGQLIALLRPRELDRIS